MKKQSLWFIFCLVIGLSIFVAPVSAHPGSVASDGCHYCRTNCEKWGFTYGTRHNPSNLSATCSCGAPVDPLYCRATTPEPTSMPLPTWTPRPTQVPLPTRTPIPTATPTPTITPSAMPTLIPTSTNTPAPTAQVQGSATENNIQSVQKQTKPPEPNFFSTIVHFFLSLLGKN